jgi:hypothetical protein
LSRPLDSNVIAQVTSGLARLGLLAELHYDDQTLRLASTPQNIVWNSNTYIGLGNLGTIDPVEETAELKAMTFVARLSGVPTTAVALALNENIQGRLAVFYLAAFDSGWNLLGNPANSVWLRAQMDKQVIKVSGPTAVIEITMRNRLAAWDEANILRYTDDDQKVLFPGDNFFEFVPQLTLKEIHWGTK